MANAAIVNFAAGETSPKSRGRFDIPSYVSSCRKLENFIAEVQGSARFRPGFRHIAETLNSSVARLIPFQFNDAQAYMLEFTPGKMRVYKDGALLAAATIDAPYQAGELDDIFFAQTIDSMYLDHYAYAPRKLTVGDGDVFTLATYVRTNDPLVSGETITITRSQAFTDSGYFAYGVNVTATGTVVPGKVYTLTGCEEVAAINNNSYRLEFFFSSAGNNYYKLLDAVTGAAIVPTVDYNTVIAGGLGSGTADNPIAVAFYENRLTHAGTNARPRTLFESRAPADDGAPRFDDFTGGTDPDHACFFSLAPVNGTVDYIAWAGGTTKYLLIGTFGGAFRVSGGGVDEPITPTSINVKQIDSFGCAATAPALNGGQAYFIQRGGSTLRAVKYSADADDFVSTDMCLNADHIGKSPLRKVVFQAGKPDTLWVVRADGQLAAMTVQGAEGIAGWHRHRIGGTDAKVLDVAVLPRVDADDQIYVVTERTVDGATYRAVEALSDPVVFPDPEDYFTGAANEAADTAAYRVAVLALQKGCTNLDAFETYNGAPATVISGLDHLEGERVAVVADGEVYSDGQTANYPTVTVEAGAITLSAAASIVHVGLPYNGFLQTQNLEMGGANGPAQGKPRNIASFGIRFLNSLGVAYGTDAYNLTAVPHDDITVGAAVLPLVFSGIKKIHYSDNWSSAEGGEKNVVIAQRVPMPCTIQFIDIEYATSDEG